MSLVIIVCCIWLPLYYECGTRGLASAYLHVNTYSAGVNKYGVERVRERSLDSRRDTAAHVDGVHIHHHHHIRIYRPPITIIGHRCITE